MFRLSHIKVRRILYEWHGGDCLYAAASSGLVLDVATLQTQLRANAQWCDDHPRAQTDCAHDARYLREIADWLPSAVGKPVTASDGRTYLPLPWAME